ncbi:MAG: hypothetical protein JNM18_03655 [Planctomycetaceae bacterium]|nr:hypothetical protein [Planctomycetaceae bacterium]
MSRQRQPATLEQFFKEFLTESDRGAVGLAGSYVDQCLKELIQKFFDKHAIESKMIRHEHYHSWCRALLENQRALGSFAVRCDLCVVLGLIDEVTYETIKEISSMRNRDAHFAGPVKLDDSYITENIRKAVGEFSSNPKYPTMQFDSSEMVGMDEIVALWNQNSPKMHQSRKHLSFLVASSCWCIAKATQKICDEISEARQAIDRQEDDPNSQ